MKILGVYKELLKILGVDIKKEKCCHSYKKFMLNMICLHAACSVRLLALFVSCVKCNSLQKIYLSFPFLQTFPHSRRIWRTPTGLQNYGNPLFHPYFLSQDFGTSEEMVDIRLVVKLCQILHGAQLHICPIWLGKCLDDALTCLCVNMPVSVCVYACIMHVYALKV